SAPPPSPTGTPMPPAEVAYTLVQSQPTPMPTATPTATITPIPVAQVSGRAAEERQPAAAERRIATHEAGELAQHEEPRLSWMRALEIALAIITLALGVASWLVRTG
ncbi:MAG: hypothetical protein J7M34_01830, partial [Anaerolineae bacterium]|nr:hypothetical protein [Anaerolineae bacterium]